MGGLRLASTCARASLRAPWLVVVRSSDLRGRCHLARGPLLGPKSDIAIAARARCSVGGGHELSGWSGGGIGRSGASGLGLDDAEGEARWGGLLASGVGRDQRCLVVTGR